MSDPSTTLRAPSGQLVPCPEGDEQIPGDPYTPPCRRWEGDFNGGATWSGVTKTEVVIAVPYLGEFEASPDDIGSTYQILAEYMSERFEFGGRALRIEVIELTGDPVEDARRVVEHNVFAMTPVLDEAMLEPLASSEIVAVYVGEMPEGIEVSDFIWALGEPEHRNPVMQSLPYAAYKSISPSTEPTSDVVVNYAALLPIALGLHQSSPVVNPSEFADGLSRLPGRRGPFGLLDPDPSTHEIFHREDGA